jgi:hypothetical protein
MGNPSRHRDIGNGIPGAHDVLEGEALDEWLANLQGRKSAQDAANESSGMSKIKAYLNSKE